MIDSTDSTKYHIRCLQNYMLEACVNIRKRAKVHDASALEPPEKMFYDLLRPKLDQLEYNSLEYLETLAELQPAIQHHYDNNSHHPEHFSNGVNGMSLFDILEMICDWKAAIDRKGSNEHVLNNFEATCSRFNISSQLAEIIKNTVEEMGWNNDKSR